MFSDEDRSQLISLGLSAVRQFPLIDSTNSEALRWLEHGAPDLALVIADAQSAGRGRQGRSWFTPPQAALAFSLVLSAAGMPAAADLAGFPTWLGRCTALGALAVCQTLREDYRLPAEIKWPNDVLLAGRKTAGVLAEACWQGDQLMGIVVGIGVNVTAASVPADEQVIFPATCVEAALGRQVNRFELLRAILARLLHWKKQLAEPAFLQAWEEQLAWRGKWVNILSEGQVIRTGQLLGLDEDGQLRLRDAQGKIFSITVGELRLRPAEETTL